MRTQTQAGLTPETSSFQAPTLSPVAPDPPNVRAKGLEPLGLPLPPAPCTAKEMEAQRKTTCPRSFSKRIAKPGPEADLPTPSKGRGKAWLFLGLVGEGRVWGAAGSCVSLLASRRGAASAVCAAFYSAPKYFRAITRVRASDRASSRPWSSVNLKPHWPLSGL